MGAGLQSGLCQPGTITHFQKKATLLLASVGLELLLSESFCNSIFNTILQTILFCCECDSHNIAAIPNVTGQPKREMSKKLFQRNIKL